MAIGPRDSRKDDIYCMYPFSMKYSAKMAVALITMALVFTGVGIAYRETAANAELQANPYSYIPANINDIWRGTYDNTTVIVFSGSNYYGAIIFGQNLIVEKSNLFKIFSSQLNLHVSLVIYNVPIISIPENSTFSFSGFSLIDRMLGQNTSLGIQGYQYIANPESGIMIMGSLEAIKVSLASSYQDTFINSFELSPILNNNFFSFEIIHPLSQYFYFASGNISGKSMQVHLYLNDRINSFELFIILGYILPANSSVLPLPDNGLLLTLNHGNFFYEFTYINLELFMTLVIH